jgi:hypothetical protein
MHNQAEKLSGQRKEISSFLVCQLGSSEEDMLLAAPSGQLAIAQIEWRIIDRLSISPGASQMSPAVEEVPAGLVRLPAGGVSVTSPRSPLFFGAASKRQTVATIAVFGTGSGWI